ncbi:sterol desaturase family protein [Paraherbaspirillum soli]|uniref:Sterol desaturase family protein n=1 Tax=Paraherbaspirillum soli TaxID=631222 RepID=A0ABW0MDG4_9BURK
MNMFALSFLLMLACVLGELLYLKFARQQTIPWKDVVFNLDSGHILMWIFRGVETAAFGFVLAHLNLHWVDQWHPLLQWAFAFVAWDLCFYWMHRMHHKLSFLWAVHVVHHQGEHFNLSLGIRNSWYSSLSNFPFVAILAVLGVPLEIFVMVSSFHYSVQFYNHNAIVGKSGFLDKFMVTPSSHRVHHGIDPLYINKNFGGTLLLWDKLFGTFQPERDDIEMVYGVPGSVRSDNPFWASNLPYFRYFKWPLPSLHNSKKFTVPDFFIGSGGVILFGLVIYYVNRQGSAAAVQQGILFCAIFLATIAIGGLSDGRRWGAVCWVLIALALPIFYVAYYAVRDPAPLVLMALLLLHGIDGLRRLLSTTIHTSENLA